MSRPVKYAPGLQPRSERSAFALSFKDLVEYDDVLTDLLLDIPFLGIKTKKMNIRYHLDDKMVAPSPRVRDSPYSTKQMPVSSYDQTPSRPSSSNAVIDYTTSGERSRPTSRPSSPVNRIASPTAAVSAPAARLPYYTQLLAVRSSSVDVEQVSIVLIDLISTAIRCDKSFERTSKAFLELVTNPDSETLRDLFLPYRTALQDRTPRQLGDLKAHAKRYLKMFHPEAGYEVAPTSRYMPVSGRMEACLIACKPFKKGDILEYCTGVFTHLTPEDEEYAKFRDFSLISLSSRKKDSLFLGPARFVNHDCDSNMQFRFIGKDSLSFEIIKDVAVGDELTTFYSPHYFGDGNRECLCQTCEEGGRGYYSIHSVQQRDLGSSPDSQEKERSRPARRAKTSADYYGSLLDPFSNAMGQENPEEEEQRVHTSDMVHVDSCGICNANLSAAELNQADPIAKALGRITMGVKCGRCRRHYRLYELEWPNRPKGHRRETASIRARSPETVRRSPVVFLPSPPKAVKKVKKPTDNGKRPSADDDDDDSSSSSSSSASEAGVDEEDDGALIEATRNADDPTWVPGFIPTTYNRPHLVWVNPSDLKYPFWWPALIVPESEEDASMPKRPKGVAPEERLVRYTETSDYGWVSPDDIRIFNPKTEPYLSFSKHPNFARDKGVMNANKYRETGDYPFKWKYFGDWKKPNSEKRSESWKRKLRGALRHTTVEPVNDVVAVDDVVVEIDYGEDQQPQSQLPSQQRPFARTPVANFLQYRPEDFDLDGFACRAQPLPLAVELEDGEVERDWLCRDLAILAFERERERQLSAEAAEDYDMGEMNDNGAEEASPDNFEVDATPMGVDAPAPPRENFNVNNLYAAIDSDRVSPSMPSVNSTSKVIEVIEILDSDDEEPQQQQRAATDMTEDEDFDQNQVNQNDVEDDGISIPDEPIVSTAAESANPLSDKSFEAEDDDLDNINVSRSSQLQDVGSDEDDLEVEPRRAAAGQENGYVMVHRQREDGVIVIDEDDDEDDDDENSNGSPSSVIRIARPAKRSAEPFYINDENEPGDLPRFSNSGSPVLDVQQPIDIDEGFPSFDGDDATSSRKKRRIEEEDEEDFMSRM
ncbi:hypothetical protein SmJEL517_g05258 [Synchytrium microbalum]|uniref:SET domain-containing protein n=1 Tax=Synchytrium microbalum TaxID=1806994 RepID=A0A507BX29_9FUNG|nr:uncharacterized protein SmJEL517_g05258 [Synchytrium microbalum]TPX31419.1 hypothetical protein SmJEL517_g05258 [Synchytrium microbalum]